MSYKRSREIFEAELTAQQSPFVFFGTPLPPLDPEVRDDGSYVPVWKQEVRDERGRKRFHGAFTGGFSAGYFNTVGSKEGWTPSTFVSSRSNRRKDDAKATQLRPEDFMDEEDLVEAEEARKIQTTAAFAGLGSTEDDVARTNSVMGLFRPEGDTMGARLLRKMGWRDGQGIGPKVRRKARLDMESNASGKPDTFLFAPENVPMVGFVRKTDQKGLGFSGESRLGPARLSTKTSIAANSDEEEDDDDIAGGLGRPKFSLAVGRKKGKDKGQGGIGTGILNDNGSDDEDPYEIGPRISYNRTIGGDKKKKKTTTAINPNLKAKPIFMPKKSTLGKVGLGVRKCHDGRLPLEGFVFGREDDPLTSAVSLQVKHPPPKIPPEWKSSKTPKSQGESKDYVSTADAAKASTLDPRARAALLGEKQLPGKSVFDFMSAEARQRLVAVTGKADLPAAKGEIPAGYARTEEERQHELLSRVPKLDKETSVAALSRGTGGGAPYADNDEKRSRYRAYLEHQAGFRPALPPKPAKMSNEDWLREFQEFFNCARIFKPMTGFMASRFTTASSTSKLGSGSTAGDGDATLLAQPPSKPKDPAEEAAKLGMYGPLTRSVVDFYPTRLLCKRFNVKPPAHVQPDDGAASGSAAKKASASQFGASMQDYFATEFGSGAEASDAGGMETAASGETGAPKPAPEQMVDSTTNEALEGARAGEEVFKAIFGDSDDEDD
ncbi:G patch domain-containing protein 1 [Schizothecium vesticola]|uniref:G patch domain-containing protein 1 n=1 Tax=Schizothecium vesticola TaxID=314040 RepID=A0AA40EPZ2_9PEZI|nr:G patch domain-containing protein 1 [Schizothecium vesticola]